MEPEVIHAVAFKVLGVIERFRNAGEEDSIWNRFVEYQGKIIPFSIDRGSYGVYFGEHDEELDYLVGMAVGREESIPEGLLHEVMGGLTLGLEALSKP